jgi:hypothetical protein
MNILGKTYSPPMSPLVYGGADNYFFDPEAIPKAGADSFVVWGGVVRACPDWYFGTSVNTCDVITGDPNRVVARGDNIVIRALRAWNVTSPGWLYLRQWHHVAANRTPYFGVYLQPGVPFELPCGPFGFETGTLPFIELTTTASVEIVYDINQGRFR